MEAVWFSGRWCVHFVLPELSTVVSRMGREWGGLEIQDVEALVRVTLGR